ncbi:potassium voltage-gated channel subfamily E member 2 [Arapaima gigas]
MLPISRKGRRRTQCRAGRGLNVPTMKDSDSSSAVLCHRDLGLDVSVEWSHPVNRAGQMKASQFMMAAILANLTQQLGESLSHTLGQYLDRWRENDTEAQRVLDQRLAEENFRDVVWYLMVMIGMLAFIIVAMLVSTVKSQHCEHSGDPYHKYIEEDWTTKLKNQTLAHT